MANLLQQLAKAIEDRGIETVPKGWMTVEQYAAESSMSRQSAARILRDAKRAGLVECRPFRIRSGHRVYPVPHYRKIAP
jgi:hypothetical protein